MPESTIALPFFRVPVFSLALALGIALSVGIGARQTRLKLGVVVDVGLGALVGALVGARIFHVLLDWAYFADNLSEAARLTAGGLDWHGAVIGGLLGLAVVARWRRLSVRDLLDALAPVLPLLALAGWLGCWGAVCGYGVEVDTLANYATGVAGETRDVYGIVAPRYNTQVFGMALGLALLGLSAVLARQGWLRGRRFWLLLALLSVGMFVIGFYRGDYAVVAGIRTDQWLDAGFVVWGIVLLVLNRRAGKASPRVLTLG
jgi:phosphatidylglycerol:prolipoprotein diacylglycerol transferase